MTGFKSCADTMELVFGRGMTGIVGPNGCGKSNVVDSLAWVLGEQSARSLRSQRMSDVIFGGTARRAPMQMAEVVMTVERLDEHGERVEEVEIARRVFRDGEAEYTLRGHRARLQDIRDFLAGEGIPANAYFIIEQGRVDEILSASPEERRVLIEQAADIGPFKTRRHQAELKLKASRDNLSRVEDLVRELESRMRSLKVQAGRAQRHRELSENARRLRRISLSRRWKEAEEAYAAADGLWQAARQKDAELLSRLTVMENDHEARKLRLAEKRRELDHLRGEAERLALEIERGEGQLRYDDDRLKELAQRETEWESQGAALAALCTQRRGAHGAARQAAESFAGEHDAVAREVETAQRQLDALLKEMDETRAAMEECENRRMEAGERLAGLRGEKTAAEEAMRRAAQESEKCERELAEARREMDGILASRDSLRSEDARFAEEEGRLQTAITEFGGRREALNAEKAEMESQLTSLREAAAEAGLRRTILLEEEESAAGPLREFLPMARGRAVDFLSVDAAWERAAEVFWGEHFESLVFTDAQAFHQAAGMLRARPSGSPRVTLSLAEPAVPSASRGLKSMLRAKPGAEEIAAALSARWPEALLAENLDEALRLQRENPAAAVAVRGGEVLMPGGLLRAGSVKGSLARRREIEEMQSRQQEVQRQVEVLEARLSACLQEIHAVEQGRGEAESRFQTLNRERASASGRLMAAEETMQQWQKRCEALQAEAEAGRGELARARARLTGLEEQLIQAQARTEALTAEHKSLEERLSARKGGEDALREAVAVARARLASFSERLERLRAAEEAARTALEEAESQARRLEQEREAARLLRTRIEAESAALRQRLQQALAEKETRTGRLREERDAVDAEQRALDGLDATLHAERQSYGRHKDALTEMEVRRATLESERRHLEGRLHESFPEAVPAGLLESLTDEERARPLDEVERTLDDEEEKLRRLGAVNELAVEEFQQVEERWSFLTKERDDVLAAIASLEGTIRELELTTSQRFEHAFLDIRSHFQTLFAQLFEGGTGDLRLVPEGDFLNGGVEIIAQPPGKKLQSITQLSGGEKALSAIAFLFAIFEHNPTPFCVLDEVDAALDDANVERFGRLLLSRSERIQFLCITHNKRTMAKARELYGVTMEEPGVTRFMSVRLEEAARAAAR